MPPSKLAERALKGLRENELWDESLCAASAGDPCPGRGEATRYGPTGEGSIPADDIACVSSERHLSALIAELGEGGDEERFIAGALRLISRQFACDLVEINRFEPGIGSFIPARWASGKGQSFLRTRAAQNYQIGEGFTGWIAKHQTALRIEDTSSYSAILPKTGIDSFPFKSYLGVPLRWEDELLGTIELAHLATAAFQPSHQEDLHLVATHLAFGIRLKRLERRSYLQASQQAISHALYQHVDKIHALETLWESLTRTILDKMEFDMVGLFLEDAGADQIKTPKCFLRLDGEWTSRDAVLPVPPGGDLAAIWHHQEYWYSNQVSGKTKTNLGLDQLLGEAGPVKLWIAPLHAAGNRPGLMIFGRSSTQPDFGEDESKALLILGHQAGAMLHISRSLAAPEPPGVHSSTGQSSVLPAPGDDPLNSDLMAELLQISAELTASLDIDRSLTHVLGLCNAIMSADCAVLMTYDPSADLLETRHLVAGSERYVPQVGTLDQASLSISRWVVDQQQALRLEDMVEDGRWKTKPFLSLCAVPCLIGSEINGTLLFYAKRRNAFDLEQLQLAQVVALQLANALNSSNLYNVIGEQADRLGLILRSQQIETSQSNAILEAVADGVLVTDADLNVILYNAAAERILNLPAAQVLGRKVLDFIGIFGSETTLWGDAIQQWRETPPQDLLRASIPERVLLEDGRVISVLPAPVVIAGDFIGTVSIFRDITRDVEVDRLKSEFVATVSHELRTPMTSVKGFVDLMLMGAAGDLSEQQRHFLEIVRTNTNRLEMLVADLLDISRIEAGKATLIFQDLDVHQLLVELEEYVRHLNQEESKNIQISHASARNITPIWGDLERVRQILANIVENSFDYTPDGGAIKVLAREVGDQIEIEVSDNGMGIALDEQERIFERFYRGEQALIMGVSGTGLGLAIVLNLVEMHGGRIWVMSDGPGKGATFTVSLPKVINEEGKK